MENSPPQSTTRAKIVAWCCYDWANSAYSTLLITVFVVYLQRVVFFAEQWGNTGPIVWAWGMSGSMFVGALISPIFGAFADAQAWKRKGLAVTAFCGSLACVVMALVPSDSVWTITACFVLANLAFELSLTVYNGFLLEIADDDDMNRVSAAGMGWGYVGGGLALAVAILMLRYGDSLGIRSMSARLRWCIGGTGLWWMLFSLPTLWVLHDRKRTGDQPLGLVKATHLAVLQAATTVVQVRRYGTLALFLVAFLFFNDGVQTVISQSSTFALQEIQLTESDLLGVVLMVQFLAVPGALIVGRLADATGQKFALVCCLVVWMLLLLSAWFIESKAAYWGLSAGVALVLGGTQAVSRALMGVLTPPERAAEFFGFFGLSSKAISFMGTFLFGAVIALTGSSRLAIVVLLFLFAIGLVLLLKVNIAQGIQERKSDGG